MIPKFRAIVDDPDHPLDNEFVYGVYTDGHMVDGVTDCNDEYITISAWAPVKKETLGQSTGLKDKNGVEIFEGDVVVGQQHLTTDLNTPFEIKGLVRYSKRNTMFYLDEKSLGHDKFMHSLGSSIYQFEVIGNGFANPELLEVKG